MKKTMSSQIGEINLDNVLDFQLEQVMLKVNADAADIFLLNKSTAQPILYKSLGMKRVSSLCEQSHSWKGLIWRVIQKRDLVSLPNIWIESSSLVRGTLFKQERITSYHGIPLAVEGKIFGILEVFHCQELSPNTEWFRLFRNLAEQVSLALEIYYLADD
jgi:GAF domain-containing protein